MTVPLPSMPREAPFDEAPFDGTSSAAAPADPRPDKGTADDPTARLTRAIRGGIRMRRLGMTLHAAASAPALEEPVSSVAEAAPSAEAVPPPPAVTPSRHWLRAAGRRGLRLFRPFALPLLHRFEWRVRTAVDKSDFATTSDRRLHGLEASAAAADERLRGLAMSAAAADDRLRELSREALDTNRHLADVQALLAEQNVHAVALHQEVARHVTARLDDLIALSRKATAVRLTDRDYLARTPAGWLVVPGEDERLLMAMVETGGELEPGTTAILASLLRPGDRMVDVGAHIGTMTIPAARAVGPTGQVIAIEPGARAAGLLRRSLHINSLTECVTLHDCAAGAAEGEAILHLAPVIGENSLIPHSNSPPLGIPDPGQSGDMTSARVAVRPLDDLVPAGPVRVVKIDAEGYELEVWRGMRRIIADNPGLAVIVEFGPTHLARAGIPVAEWFEALQQPGFTAWEIDEASKTLRALRPVAERAAIFSTNLLLLREPPSAWPGLRVS